MATGLSDLDAHSRWLTLAKDPIGVRHLYYSFDDNQVTWSTILDPLVLFAGKTFTLCEEYIAGWFSFFPAAHLTPYLGIHSVPPSSSVVLRPDKHAVTKYWDFDPDKQIRYRTDAEYEEHFRAAFGEAVRRRLRSDSPLLAELSGGMDSTSIVCMANLMIERRDAEVPRLDTISYYDDSDPNWNERPYFTKVEEQRGRTGIHINVSSHGQVNCEVKSNHFLATPSLVTYESSTVSTPADSNTYRVVLSGTGGDEVTGGVPTPVPELADLLTSGHIVHLAQQLKVWALDKRKPWLHLLLETAKQFLPTSTPAASSPKPAPWICPRFVKRNRAALCGYDERWRFFGPRPTFQENILTIHALQRQLGCGALSPDHLREKRYPYLDRSLIEFIYAIPRNQLVRPGQRRSLMRRALVGIVPDEILHRKRKAFAVRSPIKALVEEYNYQRGICADLRSSALGIVNQHALQKAVQDVVCGREIPIIPLIRTIGIEIWLRNHRWSQHEHPTESHDVLNTDLSIFKEANV